MEDCDGVSGVVVSRLDEERAMVTFRRNAACGSCKSAEGCLMSAMEAKDSTVEVRNEIGAKVGDKVEIYWDDSSFLLTTFSLYGIPTICVLTGAVAGYYSGGESSTLLPVAGAAAGLGVGLLLSWIFGKRISAKKDKFPIIRQIL